MTTPQYVSALEGFQTTGFYEAASAGDFNPSGVAFGAFVLFYIQGVYQNAGLNGSVAPAQFLWGNYDEATNKGWRIMLDASFMDLTTPVIRYDFGDGAMHTYYQMLGGIAAPPFSANGYIERLILAEFWQNDTQLGLAINGNIWGTDSGGDTTLAAIQVSASAKAPRLGNSPEDSSPANYCGIVAAGYSASLPALTNIGDLVGSHFREARAAYKGGQIGTLLGYDWTHRYEVDSVMGSAYSLSRSSSRGARIATPVPPPPTSLPDVGNDGFVEQVGITPVALNYLGAGVTPLITSVKNIDWAPGLATNVFKANAPPPP